MAEGLTGDVDGATTLVQLAASAVTISRSKVLLLNITHLQNISIHSISQDAPSISEALPLAAGIGVSRVLPFT
jgi:hypothetical protein